MSLQDAGLQPSGTSGLKYKKNQQAHTGPSQFHASVLSHFGEPVRSGAHPVVDSFRSVRFSFASVLLCPITSTMSPSVTAVAMYLLLLLHTLCAEGLIRLRPELKASYYLEILYSTTLALSLWLSLRFCV